MCYHVDDKLCKPQGRMVKDVNECNTGLEKVAEARSDRAEGDSWADRVQVGEMVSSFILSLGFLMLSTFLLTQCRARDLLSELHSG